MKVEPNRFTSYIFDEKEIYAAKIFSELQLAWIQTCISTYAIEKNTLTIDALNPLTSLQREAELQGYIIALQRLIDESQAASIEMKQLAAQNKEQ